jgi:hypothetical protein
MGVITETVRDAPEFDTDTTADTTRRVSRRNSPFLNAYEPPEVDVSGRDIATALSALAALASLIES